jgi:probable HAF family extracellular repeat protein
MTFGIGKVLGKVSTQYSQIGWGVNSSGQVFGSGFNAPATVRGAIRWDPGFYDIPVFLDMDGYGLGEAYGCNDLGVGCGYVSVPPGGFNVPVPCYWDTGGVIHHLNIQNPGHSNYTYARAINNVGQLVGHGDNSAAFAFVDVPLLWNASTTPTVLQSLVAGKNARATAINDAGVIVGYAHDAADVRHAVKWNLAGTLTQVLAYDSQFFGVNAAGNFAGSDNTGDGAAFFYDGSVHLLQTAVGEYSEAWAIGGSDIVAGEYSHAAETITDPAVWYQPSNNVEVLTVPASAPYFFAEALAVSSDGRFVTGFVESPTQLYSILWYNPVAAAGFDEWWDITTQTPGQTITGSNPATVPQLSDASPSADTGPSGNYFGWNGSSWGPLDTLDGGSP